MGRETPCKWAPDLSAPAPDHPDEERAIRHFPFLLAAAVLSPAATAQTLPPTDRLSIGIGGFGNSLGLEGRFDGSVEESGTRYDFAEGFDLADRRSLGLLAVEWSPLLRHQLHLVAFKDSRSRTETISRELVFEGVTFPLSAEVTGRFDIRALDLGYTWWAYRSERTALGLGLGVLEYRASVELAGAIRRTGEDDALAEAVVGASERVRAPVVSASWRYVIADRLRLRADFSALDIGWDRIDGEILRLQVAAEYFPWENVGISLGYAVSQLEAEAQRANFRGRLELEFEGVQALARIRF